MLRYLDSFGGFKISNSLARITNLLKFYPG